MAAPSAPAPLVRRERSEADVRGASALRVFDEELDRARRDGLFRVLLWRGRPVAAGRPLDRGAPDAEHVARAVARRTAGDLHRMDDHLVDAAEHVARDKGLRRGLDPAIEADRDGPTGPHWSRLRDLMTLAAARSTAALLAAPRPTILTRLGLLARYDLLSLVADLAAAHRAPPAPPAHPPTATFVVLPVFTNEAAVVEVQADIAAHRGTFLVPLPGILPHEILEIPSLWVDRQTAAVPRTASSPAFAAVRPF